MGKTADWVIERVVTASSEGEALHKFHRLLLAAIAGTEDFEGNDLLLLRCSCDHASVHGESCACDDDE